MDSEGHVVCLSTITLFEHAVFTKHANQMVGRDSPLGPLSMLQRVVGFGRKRIDYSWKMRHKIMQYLGYL